MHGSTCFNNVRRPLCVCADEIWVEKSRKSSPRPQWFVCRKHLYITQNIKMLVRLLTMQVYKRKRKWGGGIFVRFGLIICTEEDKLYRKLMHKAPINCINHKSSPARSFHWEFPFLTTYWVLTYSPSTC